jgi:hypothetical protein
VFIGIIRPLAARLTQAGTAGWLVLVARSVTTPGCPTGTDTTAAGVLVCLACCFALERRFQDYLEDLGAVVGNDARRRGLSDYTTGLLLPGERKRTGPGNLNIGISGVSA